MCATGLLTCIWLFFSLFQKPTFDSTLQTVHIQDNNKGNGEKSKPFISDSALALSNSHTCTP